MNVHDEMSDSEVLRAAADSLSAIPTADPPDAAAIMARGRTRRRRRVTGLGLAGTAAAAAIAFGLAGIPGGGPAPASATGTIRTEAFTLVKDANGTATLTLNMHQMFNPSTLQQALARDGIPALVKIGTYCSSDPAAPSPSSTGVISVQLPDGRPVPKPYPGHEEPVPANAVTVINPAALPKGTELFFDYVSGHNDHALTGGLIYTSSYSCASGLPGPAS